MSRSTTAARLLIVSLPFAHSLPQVFPPFQLPNATEVISPTGELLSSTGIPVPAILAPDVPIDIDEPLIDPLVDPISIDEPLPSDEPLPTEPIPLVTIPLDPIFSDPPVVDVSATPDAPSVSVQTFLSVIQPLLDLINQLLPEEPASSEKQKRQLTPWSGLLGGVGSLGGLQGIGAAPVIPPGVAPAVLPAAQPLIDPLTGARTTVVAPVQALVKPLVATVASVANSVAAQATDSGKPSATVTDALKPVLAALPAAESLKDAVNAVTSALKDVPVDASSPSAAAPLALVSKLVDAILALLKLSVKNDLTKRSTADTLLPGGSYSKTKLETFADLFKLLDSITTASLKLKLGNKLHNRAASDALFEFYSALASGQEPVQDVGPFTATLRNTFENLDDNSQAALLDLMNPDSSHHELAKRNGYPKHKPKKYSDPDDGTDYDEDDDNSGDKNFIKYFIKKFHYLAPTLFSLDPDIADGLAAIFTDPTIPVPMPKNLNLDAYPDQLQQFVVEIYVFESIITDPSVAVDDKISILQSLLDGLNLGSSSSAGNEPEAPSVVGMPMEASITPSPDASESGPDGLAASEPVVTDFPADTSTVDEPAATDPATAPEPVVDPTQDPDNTDPNTVNQDPNAQDPATQDPTAQDPAAQDPAAQDPTAQDPATQDPTAQDPAAQDPATQDPTAQDPTAQDPAAQDPAAQDPATQDPTVQDPSAGNTAVPPRRTMRRGRRALKTRQHDEGTSLDDAEKLGDDTLYELTGPKGTLDPLGQYDTGSYGGGKGYQPDPYVSDDYDYGYPPEANYDLGYKQAIEDYKKKHGPDAYKQDPPVYKEDPPVYKEDPPVYKENPPVYKEDPPVYKEDPPAYKPAPPNKDGYKPSDPYKSDPYKPSPPPNLYSHTPQPGGYKPAPPVDKYSTGDKYEPEPECKHPYPPPPPPPKHTTPQYVQDVVKDIYGTNDHHK